MVNEETLKHTPPEMLEYLRYLRRRIHELESTPPQQRIEELEATIRKLQVEIADLKAALGQQQRHSQHGDPQLPAAPHVSRPWKRVAAYRQSGLRGKREAARGASDNAD